MSSNEDMASIHTTHGNSDVVPGITSSDLKGPVLSFHSISYEVKEKRGFLFNHKTTEKKKLSDINGIMKPGLNAIMGPSESGKSLFLDILAARKDPNGLSGDVWVHEVPENADFPQRLGYVVHDDVVMDTLTVRENLEFSAFLRLPTTMTKEEKNEKIDEVIEELGLDEVADSKVDSKGLRKMTSIAMELILDPVILLLDEPTTGLDWTTEDRVVRLLKSISEQGRTIIFSIHQPHYSIFKLFDSLTILASGKLIYHGPAQEALGYFKSPDPCGDHYIIPAESFLGIIKGETEDQKAYKTDEASKREELAKNYAKSSYHDETKSELDRLKNDQNKRSLVRKEVGCVTPFGHQLIFITWRSFRNLVGHPQAWIAQIIATFILGLAVGATFLWLKNDCAEIQNRTWMLFFLTVHQCSYSVSTLKVFVVQKQLFRHEHISGYYTVASYFVGNILSDLLSSRFLPSFIFTCTVYLTVGSKPTVEAFFIMVFTLMMLAFTSVSMALAIGLNHSDENLTRWIMVIYFRCMLMNQQINRTYYHILPRTTSGEQGCLANWCTILSTMIASSLTLYLGTMAPQFSWIRYFSIPYYGFTALQHNEFGGRNFCPGLNTTLSLKCPNYVICSGEEYLAIQDMDLSPWGLWKNHVGLCILMIVFLIIAYLRMLYLKKYS